MPSKVLNFSPLNDNEDIYENFSSTTPVIEHGGFMSSDVAVAKSRSEQTAESTAITNTNTVNNTENTNITDNSVESNSNVVTDTTINSSQDITNVTDVNNRSEQDITSSTDTYNVDSSVLINENKNSTMNKLTQTCGMSLQGAQEAVNIAEDNSINTQLDVSNTFLVTGDSSVIENVELISVLDYESAEVDRKCVLDSVTELETEIKAINENAKSIEGGVGGDTGAKTGGNVTETESSTEKSDGVDGSVDAGQTTANESTTENTSDTANITENSIENTGKNEQSATTSATAKAGFFIGGIIIFLILAFIGFNYVKGEMEKNDMYDYGQIGGVINLVYQLNDH